ncbi:hypothetical protein SCAR479_04341 [Seiridium cardinale]|uniref:Uncharacterized protein n=1 Tax=Seiridium cardinale TaxID=138064 RepID=A0ABR2XY20_9PEZI
MASLLDFSSSPDPLGDEAPSSLRPIARRTAGNPKAYPRESSLQLPSSIARARPLSTAKSPRKQMFELDVGNERSPQRLLVTVEAEDERGRPSGVNRRLFTASPTRSISRRREATTTTVVPLRGLTDDEGGASGDAPTTRRRGRPRGSLGSKNGTPNPRGKKRAGTPLHQESRAKRHSGEASSDATSHGDALMESNGNSVAEPTPKPKTRTRKTPKKANTPAVPSSNPTGRKRGRPRKALLPNEVAGLTSEADHRPSDADVIPNKDMPDSGEAPSEDDTQIDANSKRRQSTISRGNSAALSSPPIARDADQSRGDHSSRLRSSVARQPSEQIEEASTREARVGDSDALMFDDFMGEPHSDLDSEVDGHDGATFSGQDNLTHASDFSMIAVEALPSFQASYQSNRSGMIEEDNRFADAGDETNFIISQTMESWKRSTQSEARGPSDPKNLGAEVEEELPNEGHDSRQQQIRNGPSEFGSSQSSWTRSPRRQPKAMPLSRQIFTNRAPHVDDSFSSIPDSVLQAATPGRLPMKPATTHVVEDDSNMYEDSFSEVPEEILTAATPRPARTTAHVGKNDSREISSEGEPQSASRSTNIGSDRLPTPDDTNSSTTDAKNGLGEDTQRMVVEPSAMVNTSDLNIRSSPPTISRQLNTMKLQSESAHTISRHFDTMALQSEQSQAEQNMADTPLRKSPSPQLPLTNTGSPDQLQTLQPPVPSRRPTLSPIVRAGRTLQNIMSDRSSPDDLGSSLGSPFRGSVQNDSRQSSVARSPARNSNHRRTGSDSRSLFNPIVSLSQSVRSAFASSQRAAPAPAPAPAAPPPPIIAPAPVRSDVEDPFGPDMHDYSQTEALRRSAYGTATSQTTTQPNQVDLFPEVPSSTRAALPSEPAVEHEISSMAGNDDPSSPATQRSRRMSASQRSANLSAFAPRSSHNSRLHSINDVQEENQDGEEGRSGEGDRDDEESQDSDRNDFDDRIGQEDSHSEDDQGHEHEEVHIQDQPAEALYEAGDDMDLWDIEASRPTPRSTRILRAGTQERRQSQTQVGVTSPVPPSASVHAAVPAAVDANPPRRSKIPSPWRRNTRRLIYQDNFRSPSEIDMEDSPPSDVERATSVPQITVQEEVVIQESPQSAHQDFHFGREHEEEFEDEEEGEQQQQQQGQGDEPEDDGSYELMEHEEPDEPQRPPPTPGHQKSGTPIFEQSVLQEYSMLSQNDRPPTATRAIQEKPAPARRSFFGNFDILSFFSSPRPPPVTNNPSKTQIDETPVHQTTAKPLPRSIQSIDKSLDEGPQSALRAPGLFPAIRQKIFNPSPERRVDLFSPGTALHSNDTVPDTYAETPSTPERQDFPSIPQKRNFTPLSGQSRNTASLFTPSRQGSTPAEDVRTPSPEYDDPREPDYSDEEESMATDGPSFERIPPREKPSQWDKTLSPTKSCLRSPLKPKTPGRVVEFTSSVLSPEAQANVRANQQRVLSTISNGGSNIATSNPRTAITNPSPLRITSSYNSLEHDKENTPSPSKSPERQVTQSAHATLPQNVAPAKLSSTAWSRAHWIRLDEVLQLRKRDPMQFQMFFPSVVPGKHPLSGLEVATHDAKMVLEDWHMEVVEAFRSELFTDPRLLAEKDAGVKEWDARALSKRLFALMVGEERRRSGKYVSGQGRRGGGPNSKGKQAVR